MGTYNNLLEKYKDYLKRDKVEENDEVISALTLWDTINNEISKFQYIRDDNYGLIHHLNNVYASQFKATFYSGVDFYDDAVENFGTKIPSFRPIKFIGIKSGYVNNNKTAVIEFILNTKVTDNKERVNESIKAYRDFNDDAYYGNHINRFLIYHCKEQLDEIVNILSSFAILTQIDKSTNQLIDNGILNIAINHSLIGKPSLKVALSKRIDPDDSQYKKYSDEYCSISNLMAGNEEKLLERTPVKVDDLNSFCRTLIKRHLEEEKQRKEMMETNQMVYKKVR